MFLYYLIIAPIEMIVEWVFNIFIKSNIGGIITAITGVSIVINFLALPLYNIADALQDKERQISRRLEPRLRRIRKAFKGDEQFMMVSTYYRQNNYHPLYVLRSSLSILIEIPFFIAAYHFLSHCPMLLGEHFWIFKDLGSPDRMWTITLGSLSLPINILPIIMTLINVVSAAVYTRGGTVKEKVQIYALAAVFLVLLYNSPSGLVIYWILNNIFSLCKNVIQKMKHPAAILCYIIGAGVLGVCLILLTVYKDKGKLSEKIIIGLLGIFFLCLPIAVQCINRNKLTHSLISNISKQLSALQPNISIFLFSAAGLAILLGFLLPINIIHTSPTEFSFLGKTQSPFSYIYSSSWTFLGMCVFWPMCVYLMFDNNVKITLSALFPMLLICALFNAYLFVPDYGNLNTMFILTGTHDKMCVPTAYHILSLLIAIITLVLYYILIKHNKHSVVSIILLSICIGMTTIGIYKSFFIRTEYNQYKKTLQSSSVSQSKDITPIYHFSKTKQNVIILFFDRAIGAFVPKILEEFPYLAESFSGFTFYPNTLSFGKNTNTGSPSMLAGYEYTPANINARKNELLVDKHNEACFVMPRLFSEAGYDVTITDMPLLNYMWSGDLTIYNDYPHIHGYNILGNYLTNYYSELNTADQSLQVIHRDVICRDKMRYFSLVQTVHPVLRQRTYWAAVGDMAANIYGADFAYTFSNLYFLPNLTDFSSDANTYTFITNNTPHEYVSLNAPNYNAPINPNDSNENNYTPAYHSEDIECNQAYQVNTASLLYTAKWLDYLKDNGVYNNTRIIIVSDHGRALNLSELYPQFPMNGISAADAAANNALLMVKDFNASGNLKTDYSFMSNADTIFFAIKDLPVSDINPFTGNKLTQDKTNGIEIHYDYDWNAVAQKKRKTFSYDPNKGYIIRDNLFDPANWTPFNPNETNKE